MPQEVLGVGVQGNFSWACGRVGESISSLTRPLARSPKKVNFDFRASGSLTRPLARSPKGSFSEPRPLLLGESLCNAGTCLFLSRLGKITADIHIALRADPYVI